MTSRKRTDPIPLREAAWQFAPSKMRTEAGIDRSRPPSRLPTGKFVSPQGDALISFLDIVGNMAATAVDPREPTLAMKSLLLSGLQNEAFQAFGVRTKPAVGQTPEPIPPFLFKGKHKIDWRWNTLENLGQRFEIIEVVRTVTLNESIDRDPNRRSRLVKGTEQAAVTIVEKASALKRGRHSKSDEIERAIKELTAQGVKLKEMTRSEAYDKIRDYAAVHLNANTGLGYSVPVIQRCLVRLLGKRV